MPDESLFDIQRLAFDRLQKLVKDRAAAEQSLSEAHRAAVDAAEREVQKFRRSITANRKRAEDEHHAAQTDAEMNLCVHYDGLEAAQKTERDEAKSQHVQQTRVAEAKLKGEYQESQWTVDSMHEAGVKEATQDKAKLLRQAELAGERLSELWLVADGILIEMNLSRDAVEFPKDRLPAATVTDPEGKMEKCLEDCEAAANRLANCSLPKFTGTLGTMIAVFACGAVSLGIGFLCGLPPFYAILVGAGGALLVGPLIRQIFAVLARRQVRDRGTAFGVFMAEAYRARETLLTHAADTFLARRKELKTWHLAERKKIDEQYKPKQVAAAKQSAAHAARIETEYGEKARAIREERTAKEQEIHSLYHRQAAEIAGKYDGETYESETRYQAKIQQAAEARQRAWDVMASAWNVGVQRTRTAFDNLQSHTKQFLSWNEVLDPKSPAATAVPDGILFGNYKVDPFALPGGNSVPESLLPNPPLPNAVPAFLPFPDKASVIFKAQNAGRGATVSALQAMMLRFLTGLPPGKVRFTIIDPVGLGENFAAFMHLADYDEQLITNRIWTEPGHIEKRLEDLTEHMETVIQKYLRNQYASIEQYNKAAGEVAEPYRVLVIANFPTNFTPDAARRLISIMSSGPACGVCTLVGIDSAMPLPRDFRLADMEQVAFNLIWNENQFVPAAQEFKPFPLTLDAPPSATDVAGIVKRIGEASKNAARVEVPFEYIAPAPDQIWTFSSREGFNVPIGRAGATRRQIFALGKGTSQHALVAGKTGSGKSTMIHALITNLAMMYSPDEAELYLIDFKKGVEFKMYAAQQLPHARVVAIESEREFGISVLQRLDAILKERGEKFRDAGTNDVAGYRDARPNEKLPRILFVVDEFQEFFTEDDKLAQEAGLLLDRLVRQGRAFGVHVLLGSQTLGGTYALPRSTIDQMAVRIALQCSDADAQLILSKDNNAARLLTRPGEAIYNDANGLVEGNDPFQVVWLDEDHREQLLGDLRVRNHGSTPPPLVFEGSASAELPINPALLKLLNTPEEITGPPVVWLGDAIAIKDPTAATFRPYSGTNLLLLGQQEEAALATLNAAMVALAARLRPTEKGILTILDGTPDDSEYAEHLNRVAFALGLPGGVSTRAELPAAIGALAGEVDRRIKGEAADRSPRFLMIHGLQRLRELRKADDDFGYGRRGEKVASPADQFATILREGPAVGVHVIAWCDSLTNLNRSVDRAGLKEFSLRVLFQMSPNDSAQLIDTPAASKLGRNRALYIEEGLERPEKFRPYGLCRFDWLRSVGATLALQEQAETKADPKPMNESAALTT